MRRLEVRQIDACLLLAQHKPAKRPSGNTVTRKGS